MCIAAVWIYCACFVIIGNATIVFYTGQYASDTEPYETCAQASTCKNGSNIIFDYVVCSNDLQLEQDPTRFLALGLIDTSYVNRDRHECFCNIYENTSQEWLKLHYNVLNTQANTFTYDWLDDEYFHRESKLSRHEQEPAWAFKFSSDESKIRVYTQPQANLRVEFNRTIFLSFASVMPRDLTFHCSNDDFPFDIPRLSRTTTTTTTTTAAPTTKSFKEEINKKLPFWLNSLLPLDTNFPTEAISHPTEIDKTTGMSRTTESFNQVITSRCNNAKGVNYSISKMRRHEHKPPHSMSATGTAAIISSAVILIAVFIAIVVRTMYHRRMHNYHRTSRNDFFLQSVQN